MTTLSRNALRASLCALALGLMPQTLHSAVYLGNQNTSFGGTVGNGSLTLTDDGATISGSFNRGSSSFNNALVIYIDSADGGFGNTTQFSDNTDPLRTAISGYNGSQRATATFASGFTANYAIGLDSGFGGLWRFEDNGALTFVRSVNLSPVNDQNSSVYSFGLDWTDIGLSANAADNAFKLTSTYISTTAFRSLETFGNGNLTGSAGWNSVSYGGYDTYVSAVPEPVNTALCIFGLCAAGVTVVRHRNNKCASARRHRQGGMR